MNSYMAFITISLPTINFPSLFRISVIVIIV